MKKTILKKSKNFLGGLFFNKKENKLNLALVILNKEEEKFKIELVGSCGYCLFKYFDDKLSADLKMKEIKNSYELNKNQFVDFTEQEHIEKFL